MAEQTGLDRPKLLDILLAVYNDGFVYGELGTGKNDQESTSEALALIPDIEAISLDDFGERLKLVGRFYNEKIEEAKKQGAIDWIEKHRAKASVSVTFDTDGVEDCVLIKVKDWQALGEK